MSLILQIGAIVDIVEIHFLVFLTKGVVMKKSRLFLSLIPSAFIYMDAHAAQFIRVDEENFNHYLQQKNHILMMKDHASQLVLKNQITLDNGIIKKKYVQHYHGVPVYGSLVSSSEVNGSEEKWWGKLLQGISQDVKNVQPKLTAAEALSKAKTIMRIARDGATEFDQSTLYVLQNQTTHQAEWVYLVSFNMTQPTPQRPHFFINAMTGQVIHQWEGLTTKNATGPGGNQKTGKYLYGTDYGPLNVTDNCQMRNTQVETYNMNSKTTGGILFQFLCPQNNYKQINGAYSPLNDAHFFGSMVYNMYKTWYHFDPLNMVFKMRVHYGRNYENAYWDGQQMTFGDGATELYPLTVLDVTGHEISHGVTEKNSNLQYEHQSGAINEAFSDMAGETAEYFMRSQVGKESDWLVGGEVIKGPIGTALRYFKQPSLDGQSIDNAADYNDSLDVHYTSGVFNKAFYILAHQTDWGIRKAFEVFLLANRTYWTSDTSFDDAACGVAKAANDLSYNISDVVSSFNAVGVAADCIEVNPPGGEIELKNMQIVNNIPIISGDEHRYFIKVPALTTPPYTYKLLRIRLYSTTGDAKGSAELFVRYENQEAALWKKLAVKDEAFAIQYPASGIYHILIKGKKAATLNLQVNYN